MGEDDNPSIFEKQDANSALLHQSTNGSMLEPMVAPKTHGRDAPTARRVRLLRTVLGYKSSTSFAAHLGRSVQWWNNFENGVPLSKIAVDVLRRRVPGMTSDWLLYGSLDGLPYQLAERIMSAPPLDEKAPRKRSGRLKGRPRA